MNKELDALNRLIGNKVFISLGRMQGKKQFAADVSIIEKGLKVLDVFKRNCLFTQYPNGDYELVFPNKIIPTYDDCVLLKEVLL